MRRGWPCFVVLCQATVEESTMGMFYNRTSKFAFVEPHEKATRRIAADFLRDLAAAVPYRIRTVLIDNPVLS